MFGAIRCKHSRAGASTLSIQKVSKHEDNTQTQIQGAGLHRGRPVRKRQIFLQHHRGHREDAPGNLPRHPLRALLHL